MQARLLHVSEDGSISRFEPRRLPDGEGIISAPLVWTIDRERLPNYLLPRDCPRVTFYACADSKQTDVRRLMGALGAAHVVAIEAGWWKRVLNTPLYIYEFSSSHFRLLDAGAGYYVSEQPITPRSVQRVDHPVRELLGTGTELRIVPSLWPLRDAVISSGLQFSCIRLRNARPRALNSTMNHR